ncbi:hypothetical protein PMAYCL1PPCAC_21496, partial [Pristionchus mayeri]
QEIFQIFLYSFAVCSITWNSFLIFLVVQPSNRNLGNYRVLLCTFAAVDMAISLYHALIVPDLHMTEFGYIFWSYRFIHMRTEYGFYADLIWAGLFYQSFIPLAFHYVYRYIIMCKPPWLTFMSRNPWRNWICLAIVTDIIYTGTIVGVVALGWLPSESRHAFAPALLEEYGIDLFSDNRPGYISFTYW